MASKSDWSEDEAKAVIAVHQARGLLPVLTALNEAFGYLHKEAIRLAAQLVENRLRK